MTSSQPVKEASLTVIIVSYNTKHLLDEMMESLQAAVRGMATRIVIVDNASRDGSADYIRTKWPDVLMVANDCNVGFGRANNQALPLIEGRAVLLLNTDAFPSPGSVAAALRVLDAHPDCAAVGMRLVGRDASLQPSCRNFPTPWNIFLARTGFSRLLPNVRLVDNNDWDDTIATECDWVPGAFLLCRRGVIDKVGLFDPRFFLYYEEVDFCRAAKSAGYTVRYCPDADVVHVGGESAKADGKLSSSGRQLTALQVESELLYFRKHYGLPGAFASVLLNAVADAVLAVKGVLRGHPAKVFVTTALSVKMLWATSFATRPTR